MIKKQSEGTKKEKKPIGRPPKTAPFIAAFKKVLERDEFDVICLTDEDLLMECNELLDDGDKVPERTFQSWKAQKDSGNPLYSEFLRLYKKALSNQRRDLFRTFKNEPSQWQKYAWILERKFSDWNLRVLSENKNDNHNTNVDITDSLTPEQKRAISQRYV